MLSLIGRELRDHIVLVAAPCVVSAVMILLLIRTYLHGMGQAMVVPIAVLMSVPLISFCLLGATQMYGDRVHKISALLCTLATTRSRILVARIAVGVLAILVTVAPVIVAEAILMKLFVPMAAFWYPLLAEVSVTVILTGFACYCMGLLIGWTTNRVWLLAGNLLLLSVAASLVYIKGFDPGGMMVLLLMIAALLLRVWHKFTSASL